MYIVHNISINDNLNYIEVHRSACVYRIILVLYSASMIAIVLNS